MNVIDFPLARLEKRRQKNALVRAGFKSSNNIIYDLGVAAHDSSFEGADCGVMINPNDVSHEIFLNFVCRFECFENEAFECAQEILDHFLSDRLSDSQDRVIEGVLELTSNYSFGFSLVDAFEIWSKKDRDTFLKILSEYSNAL